MFLPLFSYNFLFPHPHVSQKGKKNRKEKIKTNKQNTKKTNFPKYKKSKPKVHKKKGEKKKEGKKETNYMDNYYWVWGPLCCAVGIHSDYALEKTDFPLANMCQLRIAFCPATLLTTVIFLGIDKSTFLFSMCDKVKFG